MPAGTPIYSMRPERGGHSESRGSPCYTLSGRTSDTLDADLILIRKYGRSHTSNHASWRSEEMVYQPSTFLRREKEHIHRNENNKHLKKQHGNKPVKYLQCNLPCGTQSLKRIRASFKRACESVL